MEIKVIGTNSYSALGRGTAETEREHSPSPDFSKDGSIG